MIASAVLMLFGMAIGFGFGCVWMWRQWEGALDDIENDL